MTAPLAIACGGVLIDSVVTAEGAVNEGALGGNAVYSAAGLRLWLGAGQVGIVGHVPANYPDALLDALRGAGILTQGIGRSAVPVRGPEWFIYEPDGARRDELSSPADGTDAPDFGTFRRSHPIRPDDLPDGWQRARGLHLGGNDPGALLALALAFRGATITLDPGARVLDLARDPACGRVLAAVTAVIPSLKELPALMPGQAPDQALRALPSPLALLKRGSQGVLLRAADGMLTAIPALPVTALDPTGAGDSFCGGFLAGLVLGAGPLRAAAMGTVAASFAVEGFGPHALLGASRDDRDARLADLMARLGRQSEPLDTLPRTNHP